MSRIQNILEKAERDGSVRRLRAADLAPAAPEPLRAVEAVAIPDARGNGPFSTLDEPFAPPDALVDPVRATTTSVTVPAPLRVVTGARLDSRLAAMISGDAVAAEQYRALRTRILHADNGSAVTVLLVTSPGRGEGKSMTAANLALTMSQEHQRRICLVDADLRHPQLHRLFGLPDGPGLADVIAGQAVLDDALTTVEDLQMTILPAGHVPAHPAELLGTTAMRRLIETLRSRFDCIIVDSPATMPLADVGILTPLVDNVILVVRAGITSKPAIHEAVGAIDGGKLLGLILNDAA